VGLKFGITLKNGCGFKVSENKMINSVKYNICAHRHNLGGRGGKCSPIIFLLRTIFILAAELKGGK